MPIQDDRIYARDVAAAVPAFASVAADFALGYAPAPGTRRVFKGDALERLARNQGVAAEAVPDVCFERAMATLEAGEILEAMRSAWGAGNVPGSDVRMELRSFSPQIAPQGKVVFPRTGLQLPAASDPQAEVVWRGYVVYGNNRRFGISARARITTTTTRVVAVADLSAGAPVREDQVRLESFDTFALDDRPARNLEEVVGFVPRTLIRAGSTVLRSQLSRAPEVARGDVVKVEVTAGACAPAFRRTSGGRRRNGQDDPGEESDQRKRFPGPGHRQRQGKRAMRIQAIALSDGFAAWISCRGRKPKKEPPESALDQTLKQLAAAQGTERQAVQPGSLWTPTALFSDLTSDLRARRVGDIVTILVQEKASAVSTGTVKTARNSSLQASISAAGGITRATRTAGESGQGRHHHRSWTGKAPPRVTPP